MHTKKKKVQCKSLYTLWTKSSILLNPTGPFVTTKNVSRKIIVLKEEENLIYTFDNFLTNFFKYPLHLLSVI